MITLLVCFFIGGLILFLTFLYCVVGVKLYTDVVLLILHRFPEDQKNKASHFRYQHIYPAIKATGGKTIVGGQVGMTYIGSAKYDSFVLAYLPSREASKETAMRIHTAEADLRARIQQSNAPVVPGSGSMDYSSVSVRDQLNQDQMLESSIYPLYDMVPIVVFMTRTLLDLVSKFYNQNNERMRHRQDEESSQGTSVGSNPIISDVFPHLLPTSIQRQIFTRNYSGNTSPILLATLALLKKDEVVEEILYEMKMGFQCLAFVGAKTKFHSLFHLGSWSLFNLTEFPNGGDSILQMEDLPAAHYAFSHREKAAERILQLVIHPDDIPSN